MTRHKKIPCDNQAQDRWARFYLTTAEAVCRRFGLPGRAAVEIHFNPKHIEPAFSLRLWHWLLRLDITGVILLKT